MDFEAHRTAGVLRDNEQFLALLGAARQGAVGEPPPIVLVEDPGDPTRRIGTGFDRRRVPTMFNVVTLLMLATLTDRRDFWRRLALRAQVRRREVCGA
jgi:hypothetical protein